MKRQESRRLVSYPGHCQGTPLSDLHFFSKTDNLSPVPCDLMAPAGQSTELTLLSLFTVKMTKAKNSMSSILKDSNSPQDHSSSLLHRVARKLRLERPNRFKRGDWIRDSNGLRLNSSRDCLNSDWLPSRFSFKLDQSVTPADNKPVGGGGNGAEHGHCDCHLLHHVD